MEIKLPSREIFAPVIAAAKTVKVRRQVIFDTTTSELVIFARGAYSVRRAVHAESASVGRSECVYGVPVEAVERVYRSVSSRDELTLSLSGGPDPSDLKIRVKSPRSTYDLRVSDIYCEGDPTYLEGSEGDREAVRIFCGDALLDRIDSVKRAMSKDETRPHMRGVLIEADAIGRIRSVATNGHWLARWQPSDWAGGGPDNGHRALIPGDLITPVTRALKGARSADVRAAKVGERTYVSVEIADEFGLISYHCAGVDAAEFPPHEKLTGEIPNAVSAVCVVSDLRSAIDSTKHFAKFRGITVSFGGDSGGDKLLVSATDDGSTASAVVESSLIAPEDPRRFMIDAQYLLDALGPIEPADGRVCIDAAPGLEPVRIAYIRDPQYLAVVMPMRI